MVVEKTLDQADLASSFKSASFFSGKGRAIFRIVLVTCVLLLLTFVYARQQANKSSAAMAPGLIAVATGDAGTVPIAASMIHVTAISLGDPSLAIVNGKRVAEGDEVALHSSRSAAVVKLRVLKIGDGQIDLTDGTQVLSVHLEVPARKKPNRL
jgi:hypothetical protein